MMRSSKNLGVKTMNIESEKDSLSISSTFNNTYSNILKYGGMYGIVFFSWIFGNSSQAAVMNPSASAGENLLSGIGTFYLNTFDQIPGALSFLMNAVAPGLDIVADTAVAALDLLDGAAELGVPSF